jgi:hypothetical protein
MKATNVHLRSLVNGQSQSSLENRIIKLEQKEGFRLQGQRGTYQCAED